MIFADVMQHSRPNLEQILLAMAKALDRKIEHDSYSDDAKEAVDRSQGIDMCEPALCCSAQAASVFTSPTSSLKRQVLQSWWLSAGESDSARLKSEVLIVVKTV